MAQEPEMIVRSIRDAAVAVRGRRADLHISQDELARRAGVSRKWIVEFEAGKPTAEFLLVIRLLEALGLELRLGDGSKATLRKGSIDLDSVIAKHRNT
jgi:HTH-type transcriptional regulator/antitoxin HipB